MIGFMHWRMATTHRRTVALPRINISEYIDIIFLRKQAWDENDFFSAKISNQQDPDLAKSMTRNFLLWTSGESYTAGANGDWVLGAVGDRASLRSWQRSSQSHFHIQIQPRHL
jgi:hypothetical protein